METNAHEFISQIPTEITVSTPFMVSTNSDYKQKNLALSWRQIYLARAKLKASSRTSALLSGFAMVAMVELHLTSQVPWPLLIAFIVCTTLLVSIHMLALMISTCILPHIEAISSMKDGTESVLDSPHVSLKNVIEMAWSFSTVFGVFLFLLELCMLCWVKLWDVQHGIAAALVATCILVPIGLVFICFAIYFYRVLASHKIERTEHKYQELENLIDHFRSTNINNASTSSNYTIIEMKPQLNRLNNNNKSVINFQSQ